MLPEQKIWLVIFVRVPCLYELIIAIKSDGTEELMRSCLLVQQKHREPRLRVHKLYHPLRPRGDSRDGAKISRAKVGTGWNFASLNFPPFPPPPPPPPDEDEFLPNYVESIPVLPRQTFCCLHSLYPCRMFQPRNHFHSEGKNEFLRRYSDSPDRK